MRVHSILACVYSIHAFFYRAAERCKSCEAILGETFHYGHLKDHITICLDGLGSKLMKVEFEGPIRSSWVAIDFRLSSVEPVA